MQVSELEEELTRASKATESLQADKERLLSMVSRLELDKHRLESGRATTPTSLPATPASAGYSRCAFGSLHPILHLERLRCSLGCPSCRSPALLIEVGLCRDEERQLLVKVNALESEKRALAENVTSLQQMLVDMQQQMSGLDGSQHRWGPSPDENAAR